MRVVAIAADRLVRIGQGVPGDVLCIRTRSARPVARRSDVCVGDASVARRTVERSYRIAVGINELMARRAGIELG